MRQRANLATEWPSLRTFTDIALRKWHVKLTCPRCRHVRVLSGVGVWWLFYRKRWNDEVLTAPRRFYCSYCLCTDRSRVRPEIDKTQDAPTGAPLPDPPMDEWKRLIARYRS